MIHTFVVHLASQYRAPLLRFFGRRVKNNANVTVRHCETRRACLTGLGALLLMCGVAAVALSGASLAEASGRSFVTQHEVTIGGQKVAYTATVEEFVVNDAGGRAALSLFVTSYVRSNAASTASRPVVFVFNGGPSAAATGLHMQFGPEEVAADSKPQADPETRFAGNPYSLLDVADLVMFDPAESGYSRVLPGGDRAYFYSTAGDADSLAQLVVAWLKAHGREHSPRYLLGESYGSIRQVVSADLLAKRAAGVNGQIILGDSLFLMETSRRTHNIISSAVSFPLLAMTAAYHGKADKKGKSDAAFLDEVYAFSMNDYLLALSKGATIDTAQRRTIASRLAAYSGIPADYYLSHGLTIAKQDFNRELLAGYLLSANDTRKREAAPPPPTDATAARRQRTDAPKSRNVYQDYMLSELKVSLPGLEYRDMAPDSYDQWDWGSGCDPYLQSAGLCNPNSIKRSVFVDYDWPELLKSEFSDPRFRVMIIAGYYDGLSSIGTHRYLAAQLDYPQGRFELHEYPAGHATAADPAVRSGLIQDVRKFLAEGK